MFKKLDKLILKAFIGPFVATFFVTLLVLVLQFFWLYIDDFVGKGLGPGIIMEFIWYQSATLIPLALPLAVLLSSLMTFGNLGESFELVAIKSSGISLLRFMRPLMIVTVFICGIAFLFANYIIPVANLRSRTLLTDIVHAKPAFDLKEGVFYDKLTGFSIKIGDKKQDSLIRDVIVYEQSNTLQDNIIVAESGVMSVSEDKKFLEFHLKDGWRMQERGNRGEERTEYVRIGFKEYVKLFDLSSLEMTRTSDSVYRNNHRMLSMRQLVTAIDSIEHTVADVRSREKKEVFSNFRFSRYLDSAWDKSLTAETTKPSMDSLLPDSAILEVNRSSVSKISINKLNNDIIASDFSSRQKDLRLHQIEWHRKITLSLACLVLFMIGAPLGSIIRKGGLGTPLVISVIFFIVYYFISNSGEKFAKEGALQPWQGMWMATIILVPIGIILTATAMRDSQLFNKEFYFRGVEKVKNWVRGLRVKS